MEKIKITKKELDEIYDIQEPDLKQQDISEVATEANATFDEYTEYYDKNQKKVEEDG